MIDELKRIFEDFPGESEVVLEVHTRTGMRRLRFGTEFRVAGRNAALKAELDRVLGRCAVGRRGARGRLTRVACERRRSAAPPRRPEPRRSRARAAPRV